jgi:hypothetical protein
LPCVSLSSNNNAFGRIFDGVLLSGLDALTHNNNGSSNGNLNLNNSNAIGHAVTDSDLVFLKESLALLAYSLSHNGCLVFIQVHPPNYGTDIIPEDMSGFHGVLITDVTICPRGGIGGVGSGVARRRDFFDIGRAFWKMVKMYVR